MIAKPGERFGRLSRMRWGLVSVIWPVLALAQVPQNEQIEAVARAYDAAHNEGRFDQASARREEAHALVARLPVTDPMFDNWVQRVARLYESGGWSVKARMVVEEALARAEALGESNPTRINLLNRVADYWLQDRNLLKSLVYRQKAVAAMEAAPPEPAPSKAPVLQRQQVFATRAVMISGPNSSFISVPGRPNAQAYSQLADLYQQLGRPKEAAAVLSRMRSHGEAASVASFYERRGELDEAAAVYKKQAEEPGMNQQVAALQSLAGMYQREGKFGDATAALQQSIAMLNAAGTPEARNQTIWLRQELARNLQRAGDTASADAIYQQLLDENKNAQTGYYLQVLTQYANYLASTKRPEQGESILKDYLASHANLSPVEQGNALFSLSTVSRIAGKSQLAEEYQTAGREKIGVQNAPEQISVMKDFQKAEAAVQADRLDEAVDLTFQAMENSTRAHDREQIVWLAPQVARALTAKKAPDKADQIYQRLLTVVQSWSVDTVTPLSNALPNYARFLMEQRRWNEVPAVIERYSGLVSNARGSTSGAMEDVQRLTMDYEHSRRSVAGALAAAQEVIRLEESLSGDTSAPYLQAAGTLAGLYEQSGDPGRAIALHKQMIAISDLVFPAKDLQRASLRMSAAMTLARVKQFDEAESLAREAVAIADAAGSPDNQSLKAQLENILRMKASQ